MQKSNKMVVETKNVKTKQQIRNEGFETEAEAKKMSKRPRSCKQAENKTIENGKFIEAQKEQLTSKARSSASKLDEIVDDENEDEEHELKPASKKRAITINDAEVFECFYYK